MKRLLGLAILGMFLFVITSVIAEIGDSSIEIITIGSKQVDCLAVGTQKCYITNNGLFYGPINGFEYEEGYNYKIKINKTQIYNETNVPADADMYEYNLIEIISKQKAITRIKRESKEIEEINQEIREIREEIKNLLEERKEIKKEIRERLKENREIRISLKKEIRGGIKEGKNVSELILKLIDAQRIELRYRNAIARTRLELEEENGSLRAKLSNGKYAIIKIMPDTASERAIERLKLKVCSETNNCTIELKEVGEGNKIRTVYEAKAKKRFKILGFIKTHRDVFIQIDPETGEEILVKRPWWRFIASEDNTEESSEEVNTTE